MTALIGDPGVGKSFLSLALSTAVSNGRGALGLELPEPRNALILTTEDAPDDTIRPWLDALGADITKIAVQPNVLTFTPKELATDNRYEAGLEQLETDLACVRPLLVVIDPLTSFLSAKVNTNRHYRD